MKSPKILFLLAALCSVGLLKAQSPISGFMQKKGNGSLVISQSYEYYDEVYLVPQKVNGVPVFNNVTIRSTSFYGTYGISDKLNLVVNLPYISAEGSASPQVLKNLNFENKRSGLQDVSAYVKYNAYSCATADGNFNLVGALGIQTPVGNYKVNEGLQSILAIGNRATSVNAMAIGLFKQNSGFFTSGQVGYNVKNGNVPNALVSEFKIGLANVYYVDAFIANQVSIGGTDILAEGFQGFFPSTKVNYTRVGINAFFPVYGGFGLSGGGSYYLDGRNLGKSTNIYASAILSF